MEPGTSANTAGIRAVLLLSNETIAAFWPTGRLNSVRVPSVPANKRTFPLFSPTPRSAISTDEFVRPDRSVPNIIHVGLPEAPVNTVLSENPYDARSVNSVALPSADTALTADPTFSLRTTRA